MKIKERYLTKHIKSDLDEKMVFIGGARQVGKTTLSKELISKHFKYHYFNWDKLSQRKAALNGQWPPDSELIILDEFHKFSKWKSWIKGEYDTLKNKYKFLLTGSAHLNIYRRGGDSLQGRYHYYTLHPFSLAEFLNKTTNVLPSEELAFPAKPFISELNTLLTWGGFPEPLVKQNKIFLRRWHNERLERFFKEDIRELTMINDFGSLSLLSDMLPERTSSILSIPSLSRDLSINYRTVSNWLNVFENFYYCYRLSPYQSKKVNSVKKEKKLYLYDWSQVPEAAQRLENLVASHLLKFCNFFYDVLGFRVSLNYIRDSRGREVDFLVSYDNKPWFSVEVKSKNTNISNHLLYFKEKLKIPYNYQVTQNAEKDFLKSGVRVMPVGKFLSALV